MKRYSGTDIHMAYEYGEDPKEDFDGEYVRYEDVKDFIRYAAHIHEALYKNEDICALCGHDIKHPIHIRIDTTKSHGGG